MGYPSTIADPCRGQASTGQAEGSGRRRLSNRACCFLLVAAFVLAAVAVVVIAVELPDGYPEYSVAVTAVSGLDPARDLTARDRPTLSPVLNVTVHIDNSRNALHKACIDYDDYGEVTAEVYYGDAFLGRGSVPEFCALPRQQGEGVARAWGQDVAVPWFLRDELAAKLAEGEAAVTVKLLPWTTMVCSAKIGGGLSRF
ncbi:hypothetical protein HU200_032488 [Digitaria exilis]|uniref:Late embryogenesis abundant protein LEA-2 subgroup domain-containing protein n=1 Tax=Digitaria exilis TaxID=1010633 RepID=A0A835ES72_9POAL|nr:hypothetical protein HU200_032488 [Digitaria exilis]